MLGMNVRRVVNNINGYMKLDGSFVVRASLCPLEEAHPLAPFSQFQPKIPISMFNTKVIKCQQKF